MDAKPISSDTETPRKRMGLTHVVRPDAGRQTGPCGIRRPGNIVEIGERHCSDNWAKDLSRRSAIPGLASPIAVGCKNHPLSWARRPPPKTSAPPRIPEST